MGVHIQLSHGGRQRMEKYLIEHGIHVPRPVIQLFLDLCQTCQETRGSDDIQYEEEQQCTSCPDMCLTAKCMARVQAFGATGVQYFCELDENCRRAITAARTRRRAWIALNKQGQDMIKSSNKRIKLLDVGDNVRIPIHSVNRAPLGPTSLVGVVLGGILYWEHPSVRYETRKDCESLFSF